MLGRGIYFSDYSQGIYGKNIVQAYLTAKNPVRLSDLPKGSREINSAGFETWVIDDFFEKFPQYDAIVGRDEIVVKSPAQIKSVTDNIGTFSKDNPDIRYSLRHSLGIIDENPANQSLIAQNEAFRRIISEQQHVLNRHFVDSKKVRTNSCGYHKKRTVETPSIIICINTFFTVARIPDLTS